MDPRLSHVIATVYGKPWFIIPEQLAAIAAIVRAHAAGERLTEAEMRERLATAAAANGPRRGARTSGAVAVIPMYGPIVPRANLMTDISGGASISGMRAAFREALADETVSSILFDVDSPGGYVDGVEEFAAEIRTSRGTKSIVAIANYQMASAAYYLGSQADEVIASPSATVGWIGTAMVHQEESRYLDTEGVTTTIIRNPPGKLGGNPYEPLSDQARSEYQAMVDERTAQFHATVARGRGVPVSVVRSDFGQGGGMSATKARTAGLVDRVEPFDDTLYRLATGKGPVMRPAGPGATTVVSVDERGTRTVRHADGSVELLSAEDWEDFVDPGLTGQAYAAALGASGLDDSFEIEPGTGGDQSQEAEAALALARARTQR